MFFNLSQDCYSYYKLLINYGPKICHIYAVIANIGTVTVKHRSQWQYINIEAWS